MTSPYLGSAEKVESDEYMQRYGVIYTKKLYSSGDRSKHRTFLAKRFCVYARHTKHQFQKRPPKTPIFSCTPGFWVLFDF